MMRATISFLILVIYLIIPVNVSAISEKNILQGRTTEEHLKSVLKTGQDWTGYPHYSDRAGWDTLAGIMKHDIISDGEKYLDYAWKVVKATDYLEFERSGSRATMESPFGANNVALSSLNMV